MINAGVSQGNAHQPAPVGSADVHQGAVRAAGRTVLWASNSPTSPTGYGTQTAQVVRRLKREGHQVAVASNYGLEGAVSSWEGIKHFPRGFDLHSNDIIPAHLHAWAGENGSTDPLLITLYDVWVYGGQQWDTVPKVASWVPVDHAPMPPKVAAWCRRDNVTPIAMSRFGQSMMQRAGLDCLYVPHAIEPVFAPTPTYTAPSGEEITGRAFMNVPADAFCIGISSANKGQVPNRKAFPEMFLAAAMVMEQHDDVWLYVHTEDRGAMGGINLHELAEATGVPKDRLRFVDQYSMRLGIPQELMAAVYTGMDVLLQTSMGEGFGIPAVEAQACGTPVAVSNASAQPELVGDGWVVEVQPWWDPMQRSWMATPTIGAIVEALEDAYERDRSRSDKAIEFAQQYGADYVFDRFWKPALAAL